MPAHMKSRERREEEQIALGGSLNTPYTKKQLEQAVRMRWLKNARPKQMEPPGSWFIWLIRSGRGWGKTRVGSEYTVEHCRKYRDKARFHLVGQTFTDMRDVMVEGESGILSILPPSLLRGGSVERSWNRSLGQLHLENGAYVQGFSAEKPRKLRGPQCTGAWGDEPSTWADAHLGIAKDTTFDNLQIGCRIGEDPRIVLTGTPQPVKLIKQLIAMKKSGRVIETVGSTYENLDNLAPAYRETVVEQYENTRLGRQELHGAILDDVEGALWTSFLIESTRAKLHQMLGVVDFDLTVVAVDPSVSEDKHSDEAGIVVVSRGPCPPWIDNPKLKTVPHAYVMDDLSDNLTPEEWASKSVKGYRDNMADFIVGEKNNGGALVKRNIQIEDENVPVKLVWASKGKYARAEPVVMLYEKNRVHHVGIHASLEDQMTSWVPGESKESPDRMDALVWGVSAVLLGATETRSRGKAKDRRLAGRR